MKKDQVKLMKSRQDRINKQKENIMNININKLYTIQNIFTSKRMTPTSIFLDVLGFCIFIYYIWKNNLLSAISAWVFFRIISLISSFIINKKKPNILTQTYVRQNTLLLFSKTLASIMLYYGTWLHSFEIIFIAINLIILAYLTSWVKNIYFEL